MRILILIFGICQIIVGLTSKDDNNKLPEVETTIDGKFIITYPNKDDQPEHLHLQNQNQQDQQQKNETSLSKDETNPSLNHPQKTRITNLKDKLNPIMPNIGPLTAYGHPSTRYKSIDRDIETLGFKKSDGTTIPEGAPLESDSDPDPFASQRKIRPFVVPDAYAAAPINIGSHFETSTITVTTTGKQTSPITVTTTEKKISTIALTTTEKQTSTISTTTTTEKATIIDHIETMEALKSVADLLENDSSIVPDARSTKKTPTLSSQRQTSKNTVPPVLPIERSDTVQPSQLIAVSPLSDTVSLSSSQPISVPQSSDTLESPATNIIQSQQPSEANETSAELLNKETLDTETSDYDNDVFARLKDAVLIGDNPRSVLSESLPRPTVVHPRKSRKFLRRQFAAPSEGDANPENVEEDEEIIPEAAFPLPNCYRTAGGFLCCNRFLEELIYRSNSVIQKKELSECNVHAFAAHLQTEAEKMFKTTFEIIIGTGDFASKTRFKDNLICKTITDKKVILIYGTPEPYSLTSSNTPLAFN